MLTLTQILTFEEPLFQPILTGLRGGRSTRVIKTVPTFARETIR